MSPAAWASKLLPLLAAGCRSARPSQPLYRSVTIISSDLLSLPTPSLPQGVPPSLSFSFYSSAGAGGGKRSLARRILPIGVISLAGGVALSGINDLAIFHGCTSKAIEKATENQEVVEAIGAPIIRGPWYDASVAVGHRRRSVLCTFPVYGPQGSGLFRIEAIRNGEDGVLSFLRHHDWEILVMEACLEVASDGGKRKTVEINLMGGAADHGSRVSERKSTSGECEEEVT